MPMARERGIETITTEAALSPSGRRVISTSRMAIRKSLPKPASLLFTFTAWSKFTTMSILAGKDFLKFSSTGRY